MEKDCDVTNGRWNLVRHPPAYKRPSVCFGHPLEGPLMQAGSPILDLVRSGFLEIVEIVTQTRYPVVVVLIVVMQEALEVPT